MSREIGAEGEEKAVLALERAGYKILVRNYFARVGEIDIVAEKDDFICFVEVKERSYQTFGGAQSAITSSKIKKILLSARRYLHEHQLDGTNYRLDAVIIEGDNKPEIIENIYVDGM